MFGNSFLGYDSIESLDFEWKIKDFWHGRVFGDNWKLFFKVVLDKCLIVMKNVHADFPYCRRGDGTDGDHSSARAILTDAFVALNESVLSGLRAATFREGGLSVEDIRSLSLDGAMDVSFLAALADLHGWKVEFPSTIWCPRSVESIYSSISSSSVSFFFIGLIFFISPVFLHQSRFRYARFSFLGFFFGLKKFPSHFLYLFLQLSVLLGEIHSWDCTGRAFTAILANSGGG